MDMKLYKIETMMYIQIKNMSGTMVKEKVEIMEEILMVVEATMIVLYLHIKI